MQSLNSASTGFTSINEHDYYNRFSS